MTEHHVFAVELEKELLIQKQKENYLKARQILSDKQNTVENLRQKVNADTEELTLIAASFGTFMEDGDLNKFMTAIKDTQYFGKRS